MQISKRRLKNSMNNLKKLRNISKMKQEQVAYGLCMSIDQYRRRERGESPLTEEEIKKVALFYDCRYEDVLGEKNE